MDECRRERRRAGRGGGGVDVDVACEPVGRPLGCVETAASDLHLLSYRSGGHGARPRNSCQARDLTGTTPPWHLRTQLHRRLTDSHCNLSWTRQRDRRRPQRDRVPPARGQPLIRLDEAELSRSGVVEEVQIAAIRRDRPSRRSHLRARCLRARCLRARCLRARRLRAPQRLATAAAGTATPRLRPRAGPASPREASRGTWRPLRPTRPARTGRCRLPRKVRLPLRRHRRDCEGGGSHPTVIVIEAVAKLDELECLADFFRDFSRDFLWCFCRCRLRGDLAVSPSASRPAWLQSFGAHAPGEAETGGRVTRDDLNRVGPVVPGAVACPPATSGPRPFQRMMSRCIQQPEPPPGGQSRFVS